MKYKVGDLVRIKTWKEMEKEYGLNENGKIIIPNLLGNSPYFSYSFNYSFSRRKEEIINKDFPDRIVEIEEVRKNTYEMKNFQKGFLWHWADEIIKEKVIYEPINSRFEILDIRD